MRQIDTPHESYVAWLGLEIATSEFVIRLAASWGVEAD